MKNGTITTFEIKVATAAPQTPNSNLSTKYHVSRTFIPTETILKINGVLVSPLAWRLARKAKKVNKGTSSNDLTWTY